MYNPPMAATVVPVVPLVSVAPSAQRKPRLLWANVYCLLDTSSGASMAVRQMLLQLQHNGWQVDVLGATVFDHERGTAGLHGHWDTLKARQGQVVKVQDAGLQHRLLVTANTPRGLMTNREEGAWFSLYEQALEQERPDVVFYYGAVLWQAVGFSEADALFINVISGGISIAACVLTLLVIDRIGRKPLLLWGSVGMSVALVLMGVTLAKTSIGQHLRAALVISSIKNLLHPLLMTLLGYAAGLRGITLTVLVMTAALPIGANVFLFAQRYQKAEELVTASVVVSTVMALFTVSLVMYLLPLWVG